MRYLVLALLFISMSFILMAQSAPILFAQEEKTEDEKEEAGKKGVDWMLDFAKAKKAAKAQKKRLFIDFTATW